MRYLLLLSLISLNLAFGVKEVDQTIQHVFIPEGYDNNDAVQVVAIGHFKNSCFQLGLYTSEVNAEDKEIRLKITAYSYQSRCLQVEVPFFQTIYLGRITHAGEYKIIDETSNTILGTLNIVTAPPEGAGTDDTHYASILDAFFNLNRAGKQVLHLRGVYSNTCLTVPNIEVRQQEDVVIVLPYLNLSEGVNCKATEAPFEIKKVIETPLPSKFLLHVRAMGGQAINKVILLEAR